MTSLEIQPWSVIVMGLISKLLKYLYYSDVCIFLLIEALQVISTKMACEIANQCHNPII